MFLLLVAGLETTVHLLSHSAMVLRDAAGADGAAARGPLAHSPLRRGDAALRAAGSRRLRDDHARRWSWAACGCPRAARLLVVLGSVNRDEAQFPDADRFDLDRPGPQNLPFGHGIHFCLGAQLARLEGRLGTEALVTRFSRLSPGDGPVRWNTSLVVRGPLSLPLVAHPA